MTIGAEYPEATSSPLAFVIVVDYHSSGTLHSMQLHSVFEILKARQHALIVVIISTFILVIMAIDVSEVSEVEESCRGDVTSMILNDCIWHFLVYSAIEESDIIKSYQSSFQQLLCILLSDKGWKSVCGC